MDVERGRRRDRPARPGLLLHGAGRAGLDGRRIRPLRRREWGHWLLARRSVADPSDIAYYVRFGPAGATLERLVGVAGAWWAIEECFQTAKNETGLDHYQVRGCQAWYRHITLSMTALAFLVITREITKKGAPRPVLTPC